MIYVPSNPPICQFCRWSRDFLKAAIGCAILFGMIWGLEYFAGLVVFLVN